MPRRFFNSVGTWEYFFYSHAHVISWMVFIPYVFYASGTSAFWVVLLAAALHITGQLFITESFFRNHGNTEPSKITPNLFFTRKFTGFAAKSFLLAMLALPATAILPVMQLVAASFELLNWWVSPAWAGVCLLFLVFCLSAVSTKILGLVSRLLAVPVAVILPLMGIFSLVFLAPGTLEISIIQNLFNFPRPSFEVAGIIGWTGFVYYILGIKNLVHCFKVDLNQETVKKRSFGSVFSSFSPLLLPGFLFLFALHYVSTEVDSRLELLTLDGFQATSWAVGNSNLFYSIIFSSVMVLLALTFSGLPRFMLNCARAGIFKNLYPLGKNGIDPSFASQFFVFLFSALFFFLDYNMVVIFGISAFLLSYGVYGFSYLKRGQGFKKNLSYLTFGLFNFGFLLIFLVPYSYWVLPLIILLIGGSSKLDLLLPRAQKLFADLLKPLVRLLRKIKPPDSLTVTQLVSTQTVFVFWIVFVLTLSEVIFSMQVEELIRSQSQTVLLDLGIVLVLILYYVSVIINAYLMIPKVERYQNVQNELLQSNERLAKDLAERKKIESKLRYTTTHDPLTKTYTREYTLRKLKQLLNKGTRFDVVFIDIDRFKRINDLYGHVVGDTLLQDIAVKSREVFGEKALIARFGGDEFFLIVFGQSQSSLGRKCEQIINYFRYHYLQKKSLEIVTTLRLGIYPYPVRKVSVEEIIRDIDFTTRYAKSQTKTTYTVYNEDIERIYQQRFFLEEDMEERVKNRDFYAHYQPIYNQQSNQIVGFEQLLRIQQDGRYFLPPTYIEIAEETGNIQEIGWIMLEKACQKQAELGRAGYSEVYIAVNISPNQFIQTDFVLRLKKLCTTYGVEPAQLRLEIVENVMLGGNDEVRQIMNELTWSGFSLYLDDFGTGFSNMGYLKRLPIDTIKIDQSFVRTQDAAGQAVVRAIVSLARELSLNVVAEGVEEKKHQVFLRSLGVRFLQGYLISKPMPAEEVFSFLHSFKKVI